MIVLALLALELVGIQGRSSAMGSVRFGLACREMGRC